MYPYDYNDFLQLHFSHENSFDYDFDAHIAQCANVFGPDEKGFFDDHHRPPIPIILSMSDGFGSSYASSSSRSSSIVDDPIKSEPSDGEDLLVAKPSCSLSGPLMKGNERIRSFDDPHAAHRPSPRPSSSTALPKTRRSKATVSKMTIPAPSGSKAPVPELSFGRKRTRKAPAAPVHLSDEDADDESDNDTDDEYIPSPRTIKRRRTSHILSRRSAPPIRRSSTSPTPTKRAPGVSLSRNKQATSTAAINRACDGTNLNFICPECGWKQANKRLPDFKRHLRTHARPDEGDQSKGWWCKGVLLEEAHKFDLPNDAKSYVFLGQERIGGCMQTFSRRDALKRHLDNANVTCVGRPSEATND